MKLIDLLIKNQDNFAPIWDVLSTYYEGQEKSKPGYAHIFHNLPGLTPKPTDMTVVIETYFDELDKENAINVYGQKKDSDDAWALEFVEWEQWLSMPVIFDGFSEYEALAHILYEMTFFGFNQSSIKAHWVEIDSAYKDAIEQLNAEKPDVSTG